MVFTVFPTYSIISFSIFRDALPLARQSYLCSLWSLSLINVKMENGGNFNFSYHLAVCIILRIIVAQLKLILKWFSVLRWISKFSFFNVVFTFYCGTQMWPVNGFEFKTPALFQDEKDLAYFIIVNILLLVLEFQYNM